jgi:outer membrane protein OmpA-like peptidoglycan-associated protein
MKKLLVVVLMTVALAAGAQSQQYKVTQIETGSNGEDWGAIPAANGEILFSNTGFVNNKEQTGKIVTRLLVLDVRKDIRPLFAPDEMAKEYVGAPYLTPGGNELFYAISGDKSIKISKGFFLSGQEYFPLQIYYRTKTGNTWGTPEGFSFNGDTFSCGDPWLAEDGYLYFASDRPGGIGGLDIWRSKRIGETWSEPENLGPEINSDADDRSPRFDKQGNFYYSSNSISVGGLDIYKATVVNNKFSTPVRIAPFSSKGDDFAVTFIDERTGYLSSNRSGKDQIYYFEIPPSTEQKTTVKVQDKEGLPIAGALVTFLNSDDIKTVPTVANGEAVVYLANAQYDLNVSKPEYVPLEQKEKTPSAYNGSVLTLEKIADRQPVDVQKTAEGIVISVLFDLAKYNIRPDAAREIDKLVSYLHANPSVVIELSGHTDCRGSYAYNLKLSQNRADAVKAYLVSKGVVSERIVTKGYADTQLLNHCNCAPGVVCSEAEHAPNRYVKYVVVKK